MIFDPDLRPWPLSNYEALGFDNCRQDEPGVTTIGCTRCVALVINGVPCHETGCPNQTHECAECNALIPKRQHICEDCANPTFDETWPPSDDENDVDPDNPDGEL